jgi:hypothetical protein
VVEEDEPSDEDMLREKIAELERRIDELLTDAPLTSREVQTDPVALGGVDGSGCGPTAEQALDAFRGDHGKVSSAYRR